MLGSLGPRSRVHPIRYHCVYRDTGAAGSVPGAIAFGPPGDGIEGGRLRIEALKRMIFGGWPGQGLNVVSQEVVVIDRDSGDGWQLIKASMRSVAVVVVDPGLEPVVSLLRVSVEIGSPCSRR